MVNTIKFSQFSQANLSDNETTLVGSTSSNGGDNIQVKYPLTWTTSTRPSTPTLGLQGYNTNLSALEFWNGASWVQVASGGSGTVNPGLINELAFYQSAGSSVSGLLKQNNSVLSTNGSGAPSLSTTLPSALTIPQPKIGGVVDGSSAASGYVGEIISSSIPSGGSIAATNNTPNPITSINLTDGQWIINGNVFFLDPNSKMTGFVCWASTSNSVQPDSSLVNGFAGLVAANYLNFSCNILSLHVNISSPATYYLMATPISSNGAGLLLCGNIYALRVR